MVPEAGVNADRESESPRNLGREVIERFVRKHGWLTMTSFFLSAGWAELFKLYFYSDLDVWYVEAARMALTLLMGWISYNLLYVGREVLKICWKAVKAKIISMDCVSGTGAGTEDIQVPENNFSSSTQVFYNAAGDVVDLVTQV